MNAVPNKHSGKKLSEVPYEEIELAMQVISANGTPGWVIEKIGKDEMPNRDNDNWIEIEWDNGTVSNNLHFIFDKVTVK